MTAPLLHHLRHELRAGVRDPAVLLLNYLFPLGFYALVSAVMTRINPLFADALLPAMVLFAALSGPLLGLPGPLVDEREAGVYRTWKANGVPALAILAAPTLASMGHALVVATVIAATAGPLFGATPPTSWAAFAGVALAAVALCGGLGALVGVVARDARSTTLLSQAVFLPTMLLGGLMVPLDLLPPSLLPVAALLPPAHAMQAFLGLAYGQATPFDPWGSLAVVVATALLAMALAAFLFDWDRATAARRGPRALALLALAPVVVAALMVAMG